MKFSVGACAGAGVLGAMVLGASLLRPSPSGRISVSLDGVAIYEQLGPSTYEGVTRAVRDMEAVFNLPSPRMRDAVSGNGHMRRLKHHLSELQLLVGKQSHQNPSVVAEFEEEASALIDACDAHLENVTNAIEV